MSSSDSPRDAILRAAYGMMRLMGDPVALPLKVVIETGDGSGRIELVSREGELAGIDLEDGLPDIQVAILRALHAAGEPLTPKEITRRAGYAESSVWRIREALNEMLEADPPRVRKAGRDGFLPCG